MMPSGNRELLTPPPQPEKAEEEEEEESTPRLIDGSSPQEPEFTGVLGPQTNEGQVHQGWTVMTFTCLFLKTAKFQLCRDPHDPRRELW